MWNMCLLHYSFFCFRLLLYLVYLVALYLIVTVYGE